MRAGTETLLSPRSHRKGSGLILNRDDPQREFLETESHRKTCSVDGPLRRQLGESRRGAGLEGAAAGGGVGWRTEMRSPPVTTAAPEGAEPGSVSGTPVSPGKSLALWTSTSLSATWAHETVPWVCWMSLCKQRHFCRNAQKCAIMAMTSFTG